MTLKERVDRHDRQIAAIRELLQGGMRLLIETRKDLRTVVGIQRRTEAKLEALIDSLGGRGGNGHKKRRVDIE